MFCISNIEEFVWWTSLPESSNLIPFSYQIWPDVGGYLGGGLQCVERDRPTGAPLSQEITPP